MRKSLRRKQPPTRRQRLRSLFHAMRSEAASMLRRRRQPEQRTGRLRLRRS